MKARMGFVGLALMALAWFADGRLGEAQQKKKEPIPHAQSVPPGPALSPKDALAKMTVPPGFTVELVAAEPDLVNPVAMTFDEKGRIWITESIEYPRRSAGPGKDRVKVLTSTKGDGVYDKVTIFADGLNIPSGIAVGGGGVWVANAPDLLFYKEGPDGRALGKPEVVVTGFGRDDTHELPNSLTWGPDGWLYGLNGVFNRSVVKQAGKTFDFTCALFRIHPKTKEFQLFCEGTSNPWGVAFDHEGSAFISACVIDHLWHLAETGYYQRQGGPYPQFVTKIGSIVKHKHQKAAYCGITFFDSDAYPAEFRDKLYMGNIHGNCINCDELTRDGSTYFAKPRPDFLSANDAWFMPVVQKTGPDGCLYILDWYDRYHCYQDANRDPAGIDRAKGRLYRVRYKDSPRSTKIDLTTETDDQVIQRLYSANVLHRDLAQRVLAERNNVESLRKLEKIVLDDKTPHKARMHALWALVGAGPLDPQFHSQILFHEEPSLRAWGVRAGGNMGKLVPPVRDRVVGVTNDPSPDVLLQVAIAARKVQGIDPLPVLLEVLTNCGSDKLIPQIVWQNLHPLLETRSRAFLELIAKTDLEKAPNVAAMMPRVVDRVLSVRKLEPTVLTGLIGVLSDAKGDRNACAQCLAMLSTKVQTGELAGEQLDTLRSQLQTSLKKLTNGPNTTLAIEATLLAANLKDQAGIQAARQYLGDAKQADAIRLKALAALVNVSDATVVDAVSPLLVESKSGTPAFRGQLLATLGRLDSPKVADMVLGHYAKLEPEVQPKAIELLTERAAWSKQLLAHVSAKKIAASAININQVRKLLASKDVDLVKQTQAVWGTVREGRNPEREKVVAEVRSLLKSNAGDPMKGIAVFKKVCAQCHKMHGDGVEVGPDITANGRSDFEQLLSNVLDPSLVIGSGYQATVVNTKAGQVISGLLVEDNPQRIVLKVQGGKIETIARAMVDEVVTSKLSMMPEGMEKQLQPQEIADLFAYLVLDRPPTDPAARKIPGSPK